MKFDKMTDEGIFTNEQQSDAHDMRDKSKFEDQTQTEGKAFSDLQTALTKKFEAEKDSIEPPQTRKAEAGASLAEAKRLEALAEVTRLEVEKLRLQADIGRTEAESEERRASAQFISGANAYRTRMEGHKAKFEMVGSSIVSIFVLVAVCAIFFFVLA